MIGSIPHVFVMLQILFGEFMFIYPYKKRKYFLITYPLMWVVCITIGFFYPAYAPKDNLNRIVMFMVMFLSTVLANFAAFDLKFKVVLALCCSGYALQHIVYQINKIIRNIDFGEEFTRFMASYKIQIDLIVFSIFYAIYFAVVGIRLAKYRVDKNYNNALSALSIVVVLVCIGLSVFSNKYTSVYLYAMYAIICCMLAIALQFLFVGFSQINREKEIMQRKAESDLAKYESAKDAIEFINIKCHDLRKELNVLKDNVSKEELERLKKTIDLYDGLSHTGNGVVDTILMNAMLRYSDFGVGFTFSGNGEWLNFVGDADLKSLFLNIVSNAAEGASKADADKRNVSIVLEKKGDMILIVCRNYYVGKPVRDGKLPATTKNYEKGEHGFGLKSINLIAKKYGGWVSASGKDGVFVLTACMFDCCD